MIHWSPEMLETLRDMRERGAPIQKCADAVGVSYATALAKLSRMGLDGRKRQPAWRSSDPRK